MFPAAGWDAAMSADEQPRDLEKGEPKGSAQIRLAQQDAARMRRAGARPLRVGPKRVRA